jgi:hypothetical protein
LGVIAVYTSFQHVSWDELFSGITLLHNFQRPKGRTKRIGKCFVIFELHSKITKTPYHLAALAALLHSKNVQSTTNRYANCNFSTI